MTDTSEMSLWDHLKELRKCLLRALSGIIIASIISYIFWKHLWRWMTYPLKVRNIQVELINTAPVEAFVTSLKVALAAGIIFSSPWVLYHIWRFIAPGLFKNEKRLIFPALLFSVVLFLSGCAFCFFVVLPYGLEFLANYTLGEVSPKWRQSEYASFVLQIIVAFGLAFELPIFALIFSKLGLISARGMWSFFRYAIIIIFTLSAFLTPPDPLTQTLLAIPLTLIYLLSIFVVYLFNKKKI
jgi:sec-independent protein translocase protein TatC